jgi:hypothetical protein
MAKINMEETEGMMNFTLVTQSYGSASERRRAIFAIWSFYARPGIIDSKIRCLIFTDDPGQFEEYCKELPLDFVLLTPEKLVAFRGEIDFVHRVKIAVIAEAFNRVAGNVLYVDSDIFFTGDPLRYARLLSGTQCFMHKYEYRLHEMKNFPVPALQSFRDLHVFMNSRTFRLADGELQIPMDQVSWNAGVIFMHRELVKHLNDVFALTDQFYKGVVNHGCEQFAFSIVLDKYSHVDNCEDLVYHYWLPVRKPIADGFLADKVTESWAKLPVDSKLRSVTKWVSQFPDYIEKDFMMLRYNAIQAFFGDNFGTGIRYALRAWMRRPFNGRFIIDIGYHILRHAGFKTGTK